MTVRIYDGRFNDGTRHFASLPWDLDVEHAPGELLRDHLTTLDGAAITRFVTDEVTEAVIEFDYRDHHFSVNNQHGRWLFGVKDPSCPDEILRAVINHCAAYLDPALVESSTS